MYRDAPIDSQNPRLSVENRFMNVTQSQLDDFMRRVQQRPGAYPTYQASNNVLYHIHGRLGRREIVPLEQREATMAAALRRHGYPGLHRFQQQLANEYVNLSKRKVERWYNNSETVQLHKTALSTRQVRRPVWASRGLSLVQIDLLDMRNMSSRNQRWVLVCVDVFSRLIIVRTMPNKRAATVARAFESMIRGYNFDLFRPNIIADNDRSFEGEFDELLQQYKLKMIHVKTYTHGAAIVEATNKLLRSRLARWMTHTGRRDWAHPDGLDAVVHQLNTTPHYNTNVPPAVALHAFLSGTDDEMVAYVRERNQRAAAKSMSRELPRLAVGQAVRLSIYALSSAARKQRNNPTKGRKASQMASWTRTIFHVSHVSAGTVLSHASYRVRELPNKRFFRNELTPVSETELRADAAPPRPKDRMNALEKRALDRIIENNEADGGADPNRLVGVAVIRKPFVDRAQPQLGRVVGHIPPSREVHSNRALDYDGDPTNDDDDDQGNFGERYIVEYGGGRQEEMTPDDVMMYLNAEDSETYAQAGASQQQEEEKEEEEETEVQEPVDSPPFPPPSNPQQHPYQDRFIRGADGDIGKVLYWAFEKTGKKKRRRYVVKWTTPLDNADGTGQTLYQHYSPDEIRANLVEN
jgi:hypothetical protein